MTHKVSEETVLLTKDEYARLLKKVEFLEALEAAGSIIGTDTATRGKSSLAATWTRTTMIKAFDTNMVPLKVGSKVFCSIPSYPSGEERRVEGRVSHLRKDYDGDTVATIQIGPGSFVYKLTKDVWAL